MKRLFLHILIFAAFFTTMNAQTFKTFLAKEGVETASAYAYSNNITSPVLVLIASTSEKSSGMPAALTPTIEESTGKATVWLYKFNQFGSDSVSILVAVVKVTLLGNDTFMPVSLDPSTIVASIPDFSSSLTATNWFGTDTAFTYLTANEHYKNFVASHTNSRIQFIALGVNTINPILTMDVPYWTTLITADGLSEPYICFTNAQNGATACTDELSVEQDNLDNPISFYPIPAQNNLVVRIPENWKQKDLQINISDYNGSEISNSNVKNSREFVNLDLNYLTNGTYFITITNGTNTVSRPFIVNK